MFHPGLLRRIVATAMGVLAAGLGAQAEAKPLNGAPRDPICDYVIAAANDGALRQPHVKRKNGDPVRASTSFMNEAEKKEYLDAMIKKINDHAPLDAAGRRKVLIFTHGGMNKVNGAIVRAAKLTPVFEQEKKYYPIFVAWNSAPVSCYGEHLFRVRQGRKAHWVYGALTSPFYLLGDITRGLSRAPVLWARMIENGLTQPAGLLKNSHSAQRYIYAHEVARYLQDKNSKPPGPVITQNNVRQSDWRGGKTIVPDIAHTIFFPSKAVGALILDTMGTGAWDIMVRRAHELFDSPIRRKDVADVVGEQARAAGDDDERREKSDRDKISEITRRVQNTRPHMRVSKTDRGEIKQRMKELLETPPPTGRRRVDYHARSRAGAVQLLLLRLAEEQRKNGTRYSITLVGHSMGAIVSNEMLKRHPKLSFDKIIYLAAACSVKEAQDSLVPYLRQRAEAGNPAQFYNLSLHPVAETQEAMGGDKGDMSLGGFGKTAAGLVLVPRGSLLHWLDDFFTKPLNYEERRLGKWAAAITSVEMFPEELRQFVHLKMFPVGIKEQRIPEEHGEFGDRWGCPQHFWDESFCDPTEEYRPPLRNPADDPPALNDRTALP